MLRPARSGVQRMPYSPVTAMSAGGLGGELSVARSPVVPARIATMQARRVAVSGSVPLIQLSSSEPATERPVHAAYAAAIEMLSMARERQKVDRKPNAA